MTDYTHDFEIVIGELDLQGECAWDGGVDIEYKIMTTPVEMKVRVSEQINKLFRHIGITVQDLGMIDRIEIVKKP